MTEFIYPVRTADPKGASVVAPYRAIAPAVLGERFQDSTSGMAYQMATPTVFEATAYTIGYLIRPVAENASRDVGAAAFSELFLRLNVDSGNGFACGRQAGVGGSDVRKTLYSCQVGAGGGLLQNAPFAGSANTDEEGNSEQEGLVLAIHVVDDDVYPDDLWLINGKRQDAVDASGLTDGGGVTGNAFQLGWGAYSHIVGMFLHTDAMSYEECMALQWNCQTAKDIPNTDLSGLGVVPDHIWSVKRAMEVGTTGVANWVSDGATGGQTLTRVDTGLTVVEFDSQLAAAV